MTDCTLIQQLRSYRFFKMAILDWIMTLFGAFIFTKFLIKYTNLRYIKFNRLLFYVSVSLIILAIFLHKLFHIDTVFGYYLGLNQMPIIIRC